MPEEQITMTIPAAKDSDPIEAQLAQLRRWLEGYVDPGGKRHPGVIEMVARLHDELEKRNERYEAIKRGLTVGVIVSSVGAFIAAIFKDHIK